MTNIDDLRSLTEDDVTDALKGAYVGFPITSPAELLEAFQRLLDTKLGEEDS